MKKYGIGARLLACASLVREGAVLADVGTDHAYLPLWLFSEGKISRAVLSDINEGPLLSARANVEREGRLDKVEFRLCDGAAALADLGATDYTVCGMGGELIADIIEKAPHLKNKDISLVLQPMSKKNILRSFLFDNGFDIVREVYSTEDGKHYVTLLARYVGERVEYSAADAELGKRGASERSAAKDDYMRAFSLVLTKIARGKEKGGEDASYERMILSEIESRFDIK